jgi:DNA-binding Xre family transcriptional regulator
VFVVRFHLRRRIEEFELKHKRHLTLVELSAATGIVRPTLSLMLAPRPMNTTTNNLAKLCEFFGCGMGDLVEYIPDSTGDAEAK